MYRCGTIRYFIDDFAHLWNVLLQIWKRCVAMSTSLMSYLWNRYVT
jgi:hypothetical protein